MFILLISINPSVSAHSPLLVALSPLRSDRDPEYQLRGDSAKPTLASPAAPRLQALLCVPGQVLRVPLWCQRLRGLQGETPGLPLNLPSKQDVGQSCNLHVNLTRKKKAHTHAHKDLHNLN